MTQELNPGDVVVLKSNGPAMTICWTDGSDAVCAFYDFSTHIMQTGVRIPLIALEIKK